MMVYPIGLFWDTLLVFGACVFGLVVERELGLWTKFKRVLKKVFYYPLFGILFFLIGMERLGKAVGRKTRTAYRRVRDSSFWTWLWTKSGLAWMVAIAVSITIIIWMARDKRAKAKKLRETKEAFGKAGVDKYVQFTDYVLNVLQILAGIIAVFTLGVDMGLHKTAMLKWIRDSWRATMGTGMPRVHDAKNEDLLATVGRARMHYQDLKQKFEDYKKKHARLSEEGDFDEFEKIRVTEIKYAEAIETARKDWVAAQDAFDESLKNMENVLPETLELPEEELLKSTTRLWETYGVPMVVMAVFTGIVCTCLHLWYSSYDNEAKEAKLVQEETAEAKPNRHNPSPDDVAASDWFDKEANKKKLQAEFDEWIDKAWGAREAGEAAKLDALVMVQRETLEEMNHLGKIMSRRIETLEENINEARQHDKWRFVAKENAESAPVLKKLDVPKKPLPPVPAKAKEARDDLAELLVTLEQKEAEGKKCKEKCGRFAQVPSERCATCKVQKAAERAAAKKKQREAKGKGLVKEEKKESIQTGSVAVKPLHLESLVKISGKTEGKQPSFKNGIVVRGSLLTVSHGPVNDMQLSSPFMSLQEARALVKDNSVTDTAIYQCPVGAFGKVSVRAPKKGEACYITFYEKVGDKYPTTATGIVTDLGDQSKTHGQHSCTTPDRGGASGSPIWGVSDGALIGIHTGGPADKKGPNYFHPLSNEKVWEGQNWPASTAKPEN